jgi:NAD-dependent SIR2 family protein deacetylase
MKDRSNGVFPPVVLGAVSRALSAAIGMEAHQQGGPKAVASCAHLLPRHMHHNRAEIEAAAGLCGCISCEQMFPQSEIRRWVGAGTTAVCPRCDTVAVVSSGAGFELTPELLHRAHQLLFEGLGLPAHVLNRTSQREKALHSTGTSGASGDVRKPKTTAHPHPAIGPRLLPFSN